MKGEPKAPFFTQPLSYRNMEQSCPKKILLTLLMPREQPPPINLPLNRWNTSALASPKEDGIPILMRAAYIYLHKMIDYI
jgi:streptomycin 6-kinase